MRKKFQPRVLYDTSKATKIMGQLQGRNDRSSALRINCTISVESLHERWLLDSLDDTPRLSDRTSDIWVKDRRGGGGYTLKKVWRNGRGLNYVYKEAERGN